MRKLILYFTILNIISCANRDTPIYNSNILEYSNFSEPRNISKDIFSNGADVYEKSTIEITDNNYPFMKIDNHQVNELFRSTTILNENGIWSDDANISTKDMYYMGQMKLSDEVLSILIFTKVIQMFGLI